MDLRILPDGNLVLSGVDTLRMVPVTLVIPRGDVERLAAAMLELVRGGNVALRHEILDPLNPSQITTKTEKK